MRKQATVHLIPLQIYRSAWRRLQPAVSVKGILKSFGVLMAALTLSAPYGGAQTLHNFTGGTDGELPFGGLTAGKNGVLYGTTEYGGVSPACSNQLGCGTVFQLMPPTSMSGSWTQSVIYAFPSGKYGGAPLPLASPAVGPNGELYGTTVIGGAGVGDVYELRPPSSPGGTWTGTILYTFSSAIGEPQNPQAGVVIGKNGVLYGTVQFSGTSPNCPFGSVSYGCGAVYSLTPSASPGGAWTYQTLYTFQGGSDGAAPQTSLAIGKNGELYGTTPAGGPGSLCTGNNIPGPLFQPQSTGCGTVFELDPPASAGGAWTERVIYSFQGGRDGGSPNAMVYHEGVLDGSVTFGGNPKNCGGVGCGGVFRLSPPSEPGDSWTEKVIYSFTSVPDGLFPGAGVVVGKDGTLYGTTRDGGEKEACLQNPGCGIVFQLKPPQDPDDDWREDVLQRFTSTDGWRPTSAVAIGEDGNLYGTTLYGGTSTNCIAGCGVIFQTKTQH